MPKNKIEDTELEDRILDVLDYFRRPLSISQVAKILKENYDISVSPQVVKRYLLKLRKENRIISKDG